MWMPRTVGAGRKSRISRACDSPESGDGTSDQRTTTVPTWGGCNRTRTGLSVLRYDEQSHQFHRRAALRPVHGGRRRGRSVACAPAGRRRPCVQGRARRERRAHSPRRRAPRARDHPRAGEARHESARHARRRVGHQARTPGGPAGRGDPRAPEDRSRRLPAACVRGPRLRHGAKARDGHRRGGRQHGVDRRRACRGKDHRAAGACVSRIRGVRLAAPSGCLPG